MKAVVIACLEPARLDLCLDALLRWLPAEDVLVINNASFPATHEAIDRVARRWDVLRGCTHEYVDGENTILEIHEGIKGACEMWAGETILKIDEDVLLVSRPELWNPGPGELLIPAITVNNHTSRFFFEELDPDLARLGFSHSWLWHGPHPITNEDTIARATRAIYGADPAELVAMCERRGTVTRIGAADWDGEALMEPGPFCEDRRGISSMCLAFNADDYIAMCAAERGIEEVLLAEAVWQGRATYVVDTRIFCHHISYHTVREALQDLGDGPEIFHRRALVAMQNAVMRSHTEIPC